MSVVVPIVMVLAALLDGAFAGFRAAASRNARIFKQRYYGRALLEGAAATAVVAGVFGVLTLVLLAAASEPAHHYAVLVHVGARMLMVFAAYALLVGGALVAFGLGGPELRSFATVAILGPFTLMRPGVVVLAAVVGLWGVHDARAVVLTVGACAAVLGAGVWLARHYDRRLAAELAHHRSRERERERDVAARDEASSAEATLK